MRSAFEMCREDGSEPDQVRPINCRYLAMTSCLSDSKSSLLAPDNEFGSEDLTCRVGAGSAGGACTG